MIVLVDAPPNPPAGRFVVQEVRSEISVAATP